MSVIYFREHRREDGGVDIECVNPQCRIPVTLEFLRDSDPEFLTRDGDTFTLHCSNGTWTYLLLKPAPWRPNEQALTAVLIEGEAA
ncbi:hypothetical protein [Nocardia sp. NPDC049707]|uniref:hypothetical protein n=1 Tax=Nocardia sp. NPDC049707 TaxID=3154735 RepID=UPI00342CB464